MPDQSVSLTNPAAIENAVQEVWSPSRWTDVRVVVGCSGGRDSVALLRILHALAKRHDHATSPRLIVAHFNHGQRGDDSIADEAFVGRLSAELELEFVTEHQPDSASDEASMAKRRRHFLRRTAMRCGARYIAVGHHADDNVETLLHHLIRGSGPAGLCGMPMFRGDIASELIWARPLLPIRRHQIDSYLQAIDQSYRDDVSNDDQRFTRNWIRHELLPTIENRFPAATKQIAQSIDAMQSWRRVIDDAATQWQTRHVSVAGNQILVDIDQDTDSAIIIAALQMTWQKMDWPRGPMTSEHWRATADAIQRRRGTVSLPGEIFVQIKDARCMIGPASTPRRSSSINARVKRED